MRDHKTFFSRTRAEKKDRNSGVTLLFVVSILSALTSISYAMFTIAFSQIQIAGELSDSFIALYAADEGIERLLYEDRVDPATLCSGFGSPCYDNGNSTFTSVNAFDGGCYYAELSKTDFGGGVADNSLSIIGQSQCGAEVTRFVRRAFDLSYTGPAP